MKPLLINCPIRPNPAKHHTNQIIIMICIHLISSTTQETTNWLCYVRYNLHTSSAFPWTLIITTRKTKRDTKIQTKEDEEPYVRRAIAGEIRGIGDLLEEGQIVAQEALQPQVLRSQIAAIGGTKGLVGGVVGMGVAVAVDGRPGDVGDLQDGLNDLEGVGDAMAVLHPLRSTTTKFRWPSSSSSLYFSRALDEDDPVTHRARIHRTRICFGSRKFRI